MLQKSVWWLDTSQSVHEEEASTEDCATTGLGLPHFDRYINQISIVVFDKDVEELVGQLRQARLVSQALEVELAGKFLHLTYLEEAIQKAGWSIANQQLVVEILPAEEFTGDVVHGYLELERVQQSIRWLCIPESSLELQLRYLGIKDRILTGSPRVG